MTAVNPEALRRLQADPLFWTESPEALALRHGLTTLIVSNARSRIKGYAGAPPEVLAAVGLLESLEVRPRIGTVSDSDLADELGISKYLISIVRRVHGIKKFTGSSLKVKAIGKRIADMGRDATDLEISQALGLTIPQVRHARREAIGGKGGGFRRAGEPREEGVLCDVIVLTPDQVSLLGTDSDAEIAKFLNMKEGTVRRKRTQLNIPQYAESKKSERARALWDSRAEEIKKLTDIAGAALWGCAPKTVGLHRRRLGLVDSKRLRSTFLEKVA